MRLLAATLFSVFPAFLKPGPACQSRRLFQEKFSYILFLLALLPGLLAGPGARAQTPASAPGTGALTGTVLDSVSRQPIPYATVALLPLASETPITAVAADEQGRFSLMQLPAGRFRLRVQYVGYAARTRPVTVGPAATALGVIQLPAAATALTEAVVVGQKPVVEVQPDRLIYNADQDLTNAGGTAQDVLRKAPLLAVDGEGNVKLRGSSSFKVLVNNKPSPMLARNLAEALKSIPADQIQRVEIITIPSAKYDGEGTAGIINIVLKKGTYQAANGRVGLSSGNRMSSVDGSLNFRQGKVSVTSAASVGAWYNPGAAELTRVGYLAPGQTDTLRQRSNTNNRGGWYYGTLGLDYDPAAHHSLSLTASASGYGGYSTRQLLTRYAAPQPIASQVFTRDTRSIFSSFNLESTLAYTRTFAQARREWSVLGQAALTPGTFGYDYTQYDNSAVVLPSDQATRRERSRGRTPGRELTLQTDYTHPLGEKSKLEIGLKGIFRRTGSVATVDTLRPHYGTELAPNLSRATDFAYAQDVQAAYLQYSFGVGKKLTASLGARAERTALQADFRTTGTRFDQSYYTALPNGFVHYALSEASSLRLACSRRLSRPFIDYLNPFVDRSQAGQLSYGNPDLAPELTDSYELSYSTTTKTASFNVSLAVQHTGNAIEQVRLPTDSAGVIANTFRNVAATTFYQLNVYASLKPARNWDVSLGPDVQYLVRRSPALQVDSRGFTAGLDLNTSYKLPKQVVVQAFLYGTLPRPGLQGRGPANLYYQLGARKTFWHDRAELTLNLTTPFNQRWAYRSTITTAAFEQQSASYAYQRAFRLALSYRFGPQQAGRQRKSVQNDDLKGGTSRQGGQ